MNWFQKFRKILAYRKTLRPIKKGNNYHLRTKCNLVTCKERAKEIADQLEERANAINLAAIGMPRKYQICAGLAANQIGINARVFIVAKNGGGFRRYINPVIIKRSVVNVPRVETCFSNKRPYDVLRAKSVTIKADGMAQPKKLIRLEAWAFQHEFDHLEGIIYG